MPTNSNLLKPENLHQNDSILDRLVNVWSNPEMENLIPLYLGVLLYNQVFWKNFKRKGMIPLSAENRRLLMGLYFMDRPLSYSELLKLSTYNYNQKFEKCLKECVSGSYIYSPIKGRYNLSAKGKLWCRQVLKSLEDVIEAFNKGKSFTEVLLTMKCQR